MSWEKTSITDKRRTLLRFCGCLLGFLAVSSFFEYTSNLTTGFRSFNNGVLIRAGILTFLCFIVFRKSSISPKSETENGYLKEFYLLIKDFKSLEWWILIAPTLLIVCLFTLMLVASGNDDAAPFIYTLF